MNTDATLEDYRELGRLQGKEMVRKTYEKALLKHVEEIRAVKAKNQYAKGYLDGLEYALNVLNIKPQP